MARDIGEWLEGLGLGRYTEAFTDNEIDLHALPHITEADLKDIGVALGARRKLLAAIVALANGEAEAASASAPTPAPDDQAAPAPSGERRQVTVLFADLAGFTQFSDELGAEATHALLNRYFETVDAIVEGYGGSIDKHMGDNVMAVFGAPVAHDDDPERALRAALDIHRAMAVLAEEFGRDLRTHIGIASGQVVASGTGSDAHREYTVTGSSVNLASRLQDQAKAGETLISQAVQRAVTDVVESAPMGAVEVKGFVAPVPVWRLEGLRDVAAARHGPFVGRRAERRQFGALIEACLETGNGQTILARGEAGIGKTRLVEEFAALAAARGFACHKGLVLDFGVGKGQDAVRALVRSLLGLAGGGDKAARAAAADRAIEAGWLEADARVFLNDLLDLPQPLELHALYDAMDNATRNGGKRAAVADLVRGASAAQPILVTVEDIHWADALTLAQLAGIAATVADCPAVLVMTSRVEGDPLDHSWRASLRGSPLTTMDLQPLRAAEAEELASGFVETGSAFVRDCIARAEGNPMFLEQLLRNAEEGALTEVPGSIQSLVLARMDRLEPRDKQALQAASVIGQRFAPAALGALLEDAAYDCTALVAHFLVRPEGEDYLFTNALVRDGVYTSLLSARRQELHRRAAAWFVERDSILHAEHLDRADDPATAKAYLEAAQAQAGQYRYESTLRLAERGLEAAGDRPIRYTLGCLRGDMLRRLGDSNRSIEAFEVALDVADDDAQKCRAWLGIAAGMRIVDRYDEALAALQRAEAAATEPNLATDLAQIHYYRGNIYFPLGNFDGCLEQHALAREYAQQAGSPEYEAQALGGLGDAYFVGGRMITAHDHFKRCIEVCRRNRLRRIEIANLHMLGETRLYKNELQCALDDCVAAAEPAAGIGHYRAELATRCVMAYLLYDMGRLLDAEQQCEQALIIARRLGARRFEALAHIYKGQILASKGRMSEAIERVEEAIAIGRESGITYSGPWALGVLAMITRDPAQRRRALKEGELILRQECVSHNYFWFYRNAMEACLESGEWEEVERFAAALEAYTRAEPLPWTDFVIARGRTLATSGRGGRDAATIDELRRLRDEAERIGLTTALPALEVALKTA